MKDVLEESYVQTSKEALEMLGLEHSKVLLSAGYGMPKQCHHYFKLLKVNITEAYGMSENTGGITINPVSLTRIGSVGCPCPGTSIRIDKPDKTGNGEV